MKNTIKIVGEINKYTFELVLNSALKILENVNLDDIIVIINSSGGEVDETLAIIDLLKIMPNKVITINLGKAESCAGSLFICGDKRYMTKNAKFKFHSPATIFDKTAIPTADLATASKTLTKITNQLEQLLSEKTNIPSDIISEGINSNIGITLNSEECIKYGVATDIIENITEIIW